MFLTIIHGDLLDQNVNAIVTSHPHQDHDGLAHRPPGDTHIPTGEAPEWFLAVQPHRTPSWVEAM